MEEGSDLLATAAWSAPSESSPEAPVPVARTTRGSDIGRPPAPPRGRHRQERTEEPPIHMDEVVRPVESEPAQPPAARFASPSTVVLPAPAPAPDAPSAVPLAVSPAGTWAEFEPMSRPSIDDTSFYRPLPASEPKSKTPRRSENDLFSAPKNHHGPPKHVLAIIAAVLAVAAAGGAVLSSRGSTHHVQPTAKKNEISAAATGTVAVPLQVLAGATSGTPYALELPPGWSATGRLTGPATRHIDLTLSRAASNISATIYSVKGDNAADPKDDVPTAATAVTTVTTTFAGVSARGARWTLDGLRYEEFTLEHDGTAYTLTARGPVASSSQLTEDIKSLRRSWKFTS